MKRKLTTVLLALVVMLGSTGLLFATDITISKVTVTYHGDPMTAKGFTWYTPAGSEQSDLQVVEKISNTPDFRQALVFTGTSARPIYSTSEVVHKAEAIGLKPETTYFFRVGDAELNVWSEVGTFQTAPEGGAFTFINLADSQAKSEEEAILSAETFAKAMKTVSDAAFLSINGDIVDSGMEEEEWDWLLGHAQATFLNTTSVVAAGNHDMDYYSIEQHFNFKPAPNSETATGIYYSFDYSNAHFIVLNTNEASAQYNNFSVEQIQWFKDDVQQAKEAGADWIIVFLHKGPYTTGGHADSYEMTGERSMRNKLVPLISEFGVDLVLQGHDHIYARTKPIYNGKAVPGEKITETLNGKTIEYNVNPEGTIYLIPNTAGAKVYYRNKYLGQNYLDLFEIADEHHAAAYGDEPGDFSKPKLGQIQNFVSIAIDGNKLTAVTYEIDQGKNNAQPFVIDQFGIIK